MNEEYFYFVPTYTVEPQSLGSISQKRFPKGWCYKFVKLCLDTSGRIIVDSYEQYSYIYLACTEFHRDSLFSLRIYLQLQTNLGIRTGFYGLVKQVCNTYQPHLLINERFYNFRITVLGC